MLTQTYFPSFKVTILSVILLAFSWGWSNSARSALILDESFEDYPDNNFWIEGIYRPWQKIDLPQSVDSNIDSARIVDRRSRDGKHSLRIKLRHDDPLRAGNHRSEIDRPTIDDERTFFDLDKTWWFAFSVYIDQDWVIDDLYELISQLHQQTSGSPPFSIAIEKQTWRIVSLPQTVYVPLERGKWVDWVIQIHPTKSDAGFLKVWKDRKLVLNVTGKTAKDGDDNKLNWKLGVYKGRWINTPIAQTDNRTVWFDSLKVGDTNTSFKDITGAEPLPGASLEAALGSFVRISDQWKSNYLHVSTDTSTNLKSHLGNSTWWSQQWAIEPVQNLENTYSLRNRWSGLCLGVRDTNQYSIPIVSSCNDHSISQHWVIEPSKDHTQEVFRFKSRWSDFYLNSPPESSQDFKQRELNADWNSQNYLFEVVDK